MSRHTLILCAATMLFHSLAAAAPTVSFDAQGMRVGDPLTEEFRYSHCPAKDKGKADQMCSASIEVGGESLLIIFFFVDRSLASVSLSFPSSSYSTVLAAYEAKFGLPPGDVQREKVETRMGAEFTNEIATWETDAGPFVIQKYSGSISKGSARLMNDGLRVFFERRKNAKAGALSKGL